MPGLAYVLRTKNVNTALTFVHAGLLCGPCQGAPSTMLLASIWSRSFRSLRSALEEGQAAGGLLSLPGSLCYSMRVFQCTARGRVTTRPSIHASLHACTCTGVHVGTCTGPGDGQRRLTVGHQDGSDCGDDSAHGGVSVPAVPPGGLSQNQI